MNTEADRPRWRVNLFHRFTPRFQAGIEWNPAASEVGPVANWIVTPEKGPWPMVSLGTSSDRIFSPEGYQGYYASFAKSIPGTFAAPYFSVFFSEWEERLIFPFGVNMAFNPQWSLLPMNDGRNTHVLLTYKMPQASISAMLIKMRYPGISVGFVF